MRWIGQQIYDLTSRFRNDVFLEDVATGTIASGAHLGLDSNNKIVKAADGGGDLTSIVAGTGLSGTSLTGPIPTLNLAITGLSNVEPTSGDFFATLDGSTPTHQKTSTDNLATLFAGTGLTASSAVISVDASQTGITSLGTLTALTVDNIGINGDTITASGDMALVATGNDITVDTDNFILESSTADAPTIRLVNTTDDDEGSRLIFEKLRDDDGVASGQNIGEIWFRGQDAAQNTEDYAYIVGEIDVSTHGQESGQLKFGVANHDGGNGNGLILTGGSADNEIDVVIGLGAASVTTIAGSIMMSGSGSPVAAMTNAGLLSVAGQTNITSLGTLTALDVDNININGDTITASGDLAIVATGNDISVDTDNFVISSSTGQKPFLELKTTANDNKGSVFQFTKDKGAAGADDDTIGNIAFVSDDRAETQTSFARISAQVSEADNSDEAGKLTLSVAASDGTTTALKPGLLLEGEHATGSEVDVTIANGAASTTTIAGTLTMGSTATINNSGVVQVAAQTVIDHDQLANFAAGEHFTQANITTVGTIGTGVWQGDAIAQAYIAGDAINGDKIADDAVDSEHYTDGSIDTAHIADDQVTFGKASGVTPNVFGSVIKLLPSDFAANDDGGNTKFGVGYVDHAGETTYGMRAANSETELYAFVSIPEGMKATHVDIFDRNSVGVIVYEAQINATTMVSKGTGNANTTIDITDVNATATNFLAIQVTTIHATNSLVHGGSVTIAAQ